MGTKYLVNPQARILAKRRAQQRLVQMILREEADTLVPTILQAQRPALPQEEALLRFAALPV
jgi:hypothetical protein